MAKGKKSDLRVVGGKAAGNLTHDNSTNALSENQQQALLIRHKNKIAGLKSKVASATSDLRNAYKEAKSDGVTKADLDWAFLLERDEDHKAIDERRRQSMIAKWLGHPIGTQPDLFGDADETAPPIRERAFEEGKRAAMNGEACTPPTNYSNGSDGHQGWVEGWHVGSAAMSNERSEQEEGGALLMRSTENEDSGPDEFDRDADGEDAERTVEGAESAPEDNSSEAEEREAAEVL